MTMNGEYPIQPASGDLFDRVVSILEQARANVVRAVNSHMVIAYWLIGREIVQALQGGDERAEYGKEVVKQLSVRLTGKYGKGFSTTNLWYFRQFYFVFSARHPEIRHKPCGESGLGKKLHKPCGEFSPTTGNGRKTIDILNEMGLAVEKSDAVQGFSPILSWSHYRTLTKVENRSERQFYEIEAEKEGWSVPVLERQIHTLLFARLLKSRDKEGVMALTRQGQVIKTPTIPISSTFLEFPMAGPCMNPCWKKRSSTTCNHFSLNWEKDLPLSPARSGCNTRTISSTWISSSITAS
jgi:hypothetical protein